MEDELFGKITWVEEQPSTAIISLGSGKTVTVDFDVDETEEEAARNTLKTLIANETQIRHKIAVSMMERYEDCLPDITTPEELAGRITLTNVFLWEGGGGKLYYEAEGGLFTDHAICVYFDADGEIEEPELEG